MSKATEAMIAKRWEDHGKDWPEGYRQCVKCGELKKFEEFHKHAKCKHGVNTVCKECRKPLSKDKYSKLTTEYKLWHGAKTRAKEKELDFSIDIEDIIIQDKCPVFNIEYSDKGWSAPSLDRTDSSKGYIKGNIVVMSKRANALKSNASINELEMVLDYMKGNCEI